MMVTVKLFGTLRLNSGVKEFSVDAGTVRELLPLAQREILLRNPDSGVTEKTLRACLVAVNGVQAGLRTKLTDGDVVLLFPSAAGG